MYEDENGTNKPKAAILLALALLAILLGDLGGGEEWLAVLLVAEGGVPVPPLDEAVQDKVEVGLLHGIEDLLVP